MKVSILFSIFVVFVGSSSATSCPACTSASSNCYVQWPPVTTLGECASGETWKGCYSSSGDVTSCCCEPSTPTTAGPTTTTGPPSTIPCPACTSTSNNCYLTDPFIPSLGFCNVGYDFYGCYGQSGDITSCCCKQKICPDCNTTNSNCYLTDPVIPALGSCPAGKSFYGCYNNAGAVASCCCMPHA